MNLRIPAFLIVFSALLGADCVRAAAPSAPGSIEAIGPSKLDDKLQARLGEAERLASSGDYVMAQTVLDEATAQAESSGGGPALDAVDRVAAQIEFRRGRYDDSRAIHQRVLERASKRRDLAGVARAEVDIAVLYRRQNDLSRALAGFERALVSFRQLEDRNGIASVLTHIGLVRLNQGVYSASLEALRESLRLQEDGAQAELERTFHYLGLLYAGLREYETSRAYLDRGLSEARRQADASREAPLLGSMARTANLQGSYSEALSIAMEAEKLAERLDNPAGRAYGGLEHGRALIGLNRLDEAREVLELGEKITLEIEQRGTLADFRALLGEVAQRQGRSKDALKLWEAALPTYKSGDDQPQLFTTYRSMIPVLRDGGELEQAIATAQEAIRLQEQISGLNMNRRLAVLESQHREEAADRKIELLQRDNEIQALQLRQEELRRWLGLGLILGLLAFAGLLGFRYRESKRMSRRLSRSNSELIDSRQQLTLAHSELEKKAEALARAASTDPLTGVPNRRAFVEQLTRHWEDALANHRDLSIVVIDADHFKRVNDTLGHAVGDAALCALANCMHALLRSGTLMARWGGEEFAILVPGADIAAAAGLAERARAAVEAIHREDLPRLSVSIGVASLNGRALARPEALFEEADAALYQAKASGRNRVVVADPLEHPAPPAAAVTPLFVAQ